LLLDGYLREVAIEESGCAVVAALFAWVALGTGCSSDLARGEPLDEDASVVRDARHDAGGEVDVGEDGGEVGVDSGPEEGPPPVVLAHGMAGFEHLTESESLPYYYGIREVLEEEGRQVYTPSVDPFNDSTTRGEQLLAEVDRIVDEGGYDEVTIIGHSQGGLDARYVAHHRPEDVGAVVTISTPHGGSLLSDIALQIVDHELSRQLLDALTRLLGRPIYNEAGEETSVVDAMQQFSDSGIEAFNDEITDREGVYYASVAGVSGGRSGENFCDRASAPEFIAKWHDERDPIEPLLEVPENILAGPRDTKYPNDGLVRVGDARWGEFLGCIPADHLDEVGQIGGDEPGGDNDFEHLVFYRDLVGFLGERGY
jgi:triacylglycerol lipase